MQFYTPKRRGIFLQDIVYSVCKYCESNGIKVNFEEQSIIVKKVFYQYGGNLDVTKSRVRAIVVDGNTIGQGLVEKLLEEVTDSETNEELGCFATINTEDRSKVAGSPPFVYVIKSQGINDKIIMNFVNYVESSRLKLMKPFEDIEENIPKDVDKDIVEVIGLQTQVLIDEVANLKLKKTSSAYTVEEVVRRMGKDRWSALVYGLFYISQFLEGEEDNSDYDFVFSYS